MWILENRQVCGESGQAEEDRHHEGGDETAQLVFDVLRQNRRTAHQDAGNESAQHGVDADRLRDERQRAHDDQDCCHDGVFAGETVVDPADQLEHEINSSAGKRLRRHGQWEAMPASIEVELETCIGRRVFPAERRPWGSDRRRAEPGCAAGSCHRASGRAGWCSSARP